MARTRRPAPSLNHITDLLEPTLNSGFLRGHLVVEGILIEALRVRLDHPSAIQLDEMNYTRVVNLCRALGMIDDAKLGLLREIGRVRNRMAHELLYKLEFPEAFEMVGLAARSGVDFSDDTIHTDAALSEEWYGLAGIIQELFQNLAQDLVYHFDPNLDGPFSSFH